MFPPAEWLEPRNLGRQPDLQSNLTSHGLDSFVYLMGIIIINV